MLNKSIISVIIPVHNGDINFYKCLSSLSEAGPAPDEIIVVANGDTDTSWRLARKFGARILRINKPIGPAFARNLGARAARGDILFFLDSDVTVYPDFMEQITTIFNSEPDIAALFGTYDDEPASTNFLSQYKNLSHHYIHQTAKEDASTFWGACGAVRKKVFLDIGGFNKNYRRPSIEDIELGYRLKEKGYKIRLCKSLQVKHLKHWGVISLLKTDFYYRALPWTDLILRNNRFPNDLNLRISNRLSVSLIYGLLGSLAGAWLWPGFLAIAAALFLLLLFLNAHIYQFFMRKRGICFTIKAIPWHWLYYFYSGLAIAVGAVRYLYCKLTKSKVRKFEYKE